MKRLLVLVGFLCVAIAATACGASVAQSGPTPSLSIEPTATSTVVPSTAGLFDGRQIQLWVISGCECPPPPASGLIDVQIFQPDAVSDFTPLKWRVTHPSMEHAIEMPLIREMLSLDPCAPKDEAPPILPADHAWYRIPYGEIVPSGPGFEVSVLVRDQVGKEFWVEVAPKFCSAIS